MAKTRRRKKTAIINLEIEYGTVADLRNIEAAVAFTMGQALSEVPGVRAQGFAFGEKTSKPDDWTEAPPDMPGEEEDDDGEG